MTDAQRRQLATDGYLLIHDLLPEDTVTRVRDAFDAVERETRDAWWASHRDSDKRGSYGLGKTAHVVEPVVQYNDLFLDILEHPAVVDVLRTFMGPDPMMIDNAFHVKPGGTPAHTRWHRDGKEWALDPSTWSEADREAWEADPGTDLPFFKIKVFYFVDDIRDETGPFSVLPGSHLFEVENPPPEGRLEELEGHAKMTGPAGSVVLWNGRILHTALDNRDTRPRRMLLYNYTHFGMKQYDNCVPRGAFRERLRSRSPICQQLMGLQRAPLSAFESLPAAH